jgi:peptidoglycan hydrolase-like protein with peptidoglycan-binding domain
MSKYITMDALPPVEPPAAEPTDPPAQAPVEPRTLRYTPGLPVMKGEDVTLAQARLQALGYAPGTVNGVFGPKTKAAVLAFQLDAFPGQPKEWDGIVGPKTWGELK